MNNTNRFKMLISTGSFCLASLATPVTLAETTDRAWQGPKAYIGAGASAARLDNAKVADNDIATGDLSDFDDDRVTGQVYGGVMLAPWFGLEAGYLHLPEYKDNGFEIDGSGVSAAAVLAAPVGDRTELYAKGGQVWWDVDVDGPLGFDAEIDGSDWFYGAGVNFGLMPNLGLRLEYTRYELDGGDGEADLDLATVGLHYSF